MPTPTPQDSALEAGTQAPPTPAVSSPSAGQPTSGSGQPAPAPAAIDYDTLVDKLLANQKFNASLTKTVQSVKDKRFSEVERIKAYLDANGGDTEKAKREMVLDEMVNNFGADGLGRPSPQINQTDLQSQTASILNAAGIPFNDPEVAQLAAQPFTSEGQWYNSLTQLVTRRLKGDHPPASALAVGNGRPALTPDRDTQLATKTAQLQDLMKQPSLNMDKIRQVKEELRALV